MKRCFKCGAEKPLAEFYAHKKMADGHLNKCKGCAKADVSAHRHGAGRAQVLAYDRQRARTPGRSAQMRVTLAGWRSAHPERRAAQVALGNAVRRGLVTPWPACAVPECSDKPEAHHPDYSAPLAVSWLCSAHHKQAHALARDTD